MVDGLLDKFSMERWSLSGFPLFFSFLVASIPLVIVFYIHQKRKTLRIARYENEKEEPIDEQLLAEAQEAVQDFDLDLLETLHQRYLHLQSFQTINGHDDSSMTNLVVFLKEKGVDADFYFHQTYPVGFASVTGGMGEYFLFVDPERQEEALQLLNEYFKSDP